MAEKSKNKHSINRTVDQAEKPFPLVLSKIPALKKKKRKNRHYCDMCGADFRLAGTLALHIKNYHSDDEPDNNLPSLLDCEVCAKSFRSTMALRSHQRDKKHGKYSDRPPIVSQIKSPFDKEIRDHKQDVFTLMVGEQTKRKNDEALKTALRKQLAVDDRPYYNVDAYQLAIRTMTTGEAYTLAKDETRSLALIEEHKKNVETSVIAPEIRTADKSFLKTSVTVTNIRGEKVEISTTGRDSADQSAFRKAISLNYSHCCAITGDTIAIEAAHIQTHSDHYDNSIDNGIMLSVGLHRLFDKGIMIINPERMTVHFTQDCFYKKYLEGAPVKSGKTPINKDKLTAKNKTF